MSELPKRSSGDSAATVQINPPDIVRRRVTAWGGIRIEVIEVIRRDQFEYKFHASLHLLIMSERTSRDDGETLVDGLPISTARDFGRKLILVPAGQRVSLISTSIRTALCSAAKVVSLMSTTVISNPNVSAGEAMARSTRNIGTSAIRSGARHRALREISPIGKGKPCSTQTHVEAIDAK